MHPWSMKLVTLFQLTTISTSTLKPKSHGNTGNNFGILWLEAEPMAPAPKADILPQAETTSCTVQLYMP